MPGLILPFYSSEESSTFRKMPIGNVGKKKAQRDSINPLIDKEALNRLSLVNSNPKKLEAEVIDTKDIESNPRISKSEGSEKEDVSSNPRLS